MSGIVVMVGTAWAFQRGGQDFLVFYSAWRLVLDGKGSEIYIHSPDRFLYAPGFAWLLCPLALLPFKAALAVWCFAKAAALGVGIRSFLKLPDRHSYADYALGWFALPLLMRPVLIDFQYGQVNIFILVICILAMTRHFKGKIKSLLIDFLLWFLLALAAVTKLFVTPLLLVPWIARAGVNSKKLKTEKTAVFLGLFSGLCSPVFTEGFLGMVDLMAGWRDAIIAKGLPLESHNQSFIAFLYHFFSGKPTQVLSEGGARLDLGYALLSLENITVLSIIWSAIFLVLICYWLFFASKKPLSRWIAVCVGLLIIPSHLVWKPYFVMGIPLAAVAIKNLYPRWYLIVALFIAINLTGFDFVGHGWAPKLEAASWSLWMHFILIFIALIGKKKGETA